MITNIGESIQDKLINDQICKLKCKLSKAVGCKKSELRKKVI